MGHVQVRKTEPERRPDHDADEGEGTDGQPLDDGHVLGSLRLLLIAGIDTTWSAIGSCSGIWPRRPRTASDWSPSRR